MIVVEVVDVKHELHLLVELGAVDLEQTSQELLRIQVPVVVYIEDREEALGKQAWQLTVVKETDLVDALGLVVTATLQILVDVFEVGQADLHFEIACLGRL